MRWHMYVIDWHRPKHTENIWLLIYCDYQKYYAHVVEAEKGHLTLCMSTIILKETENVSHIMKWWQEKQPQTVPNNYFF